MRPRTEVLLGLGGFAVLVALVTAVGQSRNRVMDQDFRASTFSTDPAGAKALSDALERLGVTVARFRRRTRELRDVPRGPRQTLLIIQPMMGFTGPEADAVAQFAAADRGRGDLVLVGPRSQDLMRCFGWATHSQFLDSAAVSSPGVGAGPRSPWARHFLLASTDTLSVDSSRVNDIGEVRCARPSVRAIDTLLVASGGRIEALRLHIGETRQVTLVADDNLFRNRSLRSSDAGPIVLGLFYRRYERVIVDEFHQGHGDSGSLFDATFAWSRRSPWGWAVWQAAVVGLLALLIGAIRFGAASSTIPRQRRSSTEHVGALATALAAAKGHDTAIALVVQGLRRRLAPAGFGVRAEMHGWLNNLEHNVSSSRARAAVRSLQALTRPGQPGTGVLEAANAVEDVWEELRP